MSAPSDREVIWVWGQTGNKGKSWFQGYLETRYGYARVVSLDLKIKRANVLHALTKQPPSTNDISCSTNRDQLATNHVTTPFWKQSKMVLQYRQSIITMLYDLKFQTYFVFSNHMPNTRQLSKDRWNIFRIVKAGLKDTTIQVWKNQHGNKTFESNLKKENDDDDNECWIQEHNTIENPTWE